MAEPAALRDFVNQRTPKGRWVSRHPDHPMSEADLALHDDMIDAEELAEYGDDEDLYEDPDSDGYGWERRALDRAYACS